MPWQLSVATGSACPSNVYNPLSLTHTNWPMDSLKLTSETTKLLTSLGVSNSSDASNLREVAEVFATTDLTSVDLQGKSTELMTLLQLCQGIISHLIRNEQSEGGKGSSHQVEKLQIQNRKLRQMLQLHQKSFLATLLNSNSNCTHCPKSFIDENHLESHFQRRHEQTLTENDSFPLLDRINEYKGLAKVKNEQLDQLKSQMDELKTKLEEAEKEIKDEKAARTALEQAISSQLDSKMDQIEKKISDFFHLPMGDGASTGQTSSQPPGQEFYWAQIAVLKQLASEVSSLKENISLTQSNQLLPVSPANKLQSAKANYQQVEYIVKQKLDELNIEEDSTGISEECLETAMKHLKEKRLANGQSQVQSDDQIEPSTEEPERPVPSVRTSKIPPISILKKSSEQGNKESGKEQKKLQWSN